LYYFWNQLQRQNRGWQSEVGWTQEYQTFNLRNNVHISALCRFLQYQYQQMGVQVHLQTPSFPWQQELVTFPDSDVSCSVARTVCGILRLFPRGICHHGNRKTGNDHVLHCNQEVFSRNACLCEDPSYHKLCVRCPLRVVVFYGGFYSAYVSTIPQGLAIHLLHRTNYFSHVVHSLPYTHLSSV